MELNEYQKKAMTTCMSSSENLSYMLLNLQGEVGEFSSKIAKLIRKGQGSIDSNGFTFTNYSVLSKNDPELMKEAGDILWQLSGLCTVMGWDLEEVAMENLSKLASRKDRGVIAGDGDNR